MNPELHTAAMINAAANAGNSSPTMELFLPGFLVCVLAVLVVIALLVSYDAILGDRRDNEEDTYNNRY